MQPDFPQGFPNERGALTPNPAWRRCGIGFKDFKPAGCGETRGVGRREHPEPPAPRPPRTAPSEPRSPQPRGARTHLRLSVPGRDRARLHHRHPRHPRRHRARSRAAPAPPSPPPAHSAGLRHGGGRSARPSRRRDAALQPVARGGNGGAALPCGGGNGTCGLG